MDEHGYCLIKGLSHEAEWRDWRDPASFRKFMIRIPIKNCLRLHEKRTRRPIGEIPLLFIQDLA